MAAVDDAPEQSGAQADAGPLYEDFFITLTAAELTIRRYYFPLGTPKTVAVANIERIWHGPDPELGLNAFKKKTWGLALSSVWWAYATLREVRDDRNNFVVREKGDHLFRHGFSVERPDDALQAFRTVAPDAFH